MFTKTEAPSPKPSSTTSPTADVPIEPTFLTAAERRELAANERTIERGAKAWLESGLAWQAILEKRQYREAAPTFDEYIELRGHERSAVYRLKAAAVFFQEHEPHFERLKLRITTEYQLRPIVGCEAGDVPEILRIAARKATAGDDGWKVPAHRIIAEAKDRWLLDAEELRSRQEAKERREAESKQRREEAARAAREQEPEPEADPLLDSSQSFNSNAPRLANIPETITGEYCEVRPAKDSPTLWEGKLEIWAEDLHAFRSQVASMFLPLFQKHGHDQDFLVAAAKSFHNWSEEVAGRQPTRRAR